MNFVCFVLVPASREKQTKLTPNLDSYKGEEKKYEVSGMFWGKVRIRCCCGWIATTRKQFVSLGSKFGNLIREKNERKKMIFMWASVLNDAKTDWSILGISYLIVSRLLPSLPTTSFPQEKHAL